jgi:Ni,Fe-hydrogenase III large subunit
VPETVSRFRIVALELERMYNHVHVIANLSKGASQTVLTSHLSWIFEECLRLNNEFSGDRFLRGINQIGDIKVNLNNLEKIKGKVKLLKEKFMELYSHSLKSWNFIDRIYKTASLSPEKALDIGITGPSLRACGIKCDLREFDDLYGDFKIITKEDGDALARMEVRSLEFMESCDIIMSQLDLMGDDKEESFKDIVDGEGIGYAESPTGIITYFVSLNNGKVEYVYVSTPSLFGFKAFADTLEGFIFTDFSFAFDSYGVSFADLAR